MDLLGVRDVRKVFHRIASSSTADVALQGNPCVSRMASVLIYTAHGLALSTSEVPLGSFLRLFPFTKNHLA